MIDRISNKFIIEGTSETSQILISRLIVIAIGITLCYAGFYLALGIKQLFIVTNIFLALFSSALYLLKNNSFKKSRVFFISSVNLNLVITCLLAGPNSGVSYFFFPTAAGTLVLFNNKERLNTAIFTLIPIVLFSALQIPSFANAFTLPIDPSIIKSINDCSSIISMICVVYIVIYFIRQNNINLYQYKLEAANMHSILESSPDIVWQIDNDLYIQNYNSSFSKFLKKEFNFDAFRGVHCEEIYNLIKKENDHFETWNRHYQEVLSGKNLKLEDHRFINGKHYILELHMNPIYLNSEITGAIIHSRNITDKKFQETKLKNSLEENKLLATVASYTNNAVLLLGDDFKTIWANDGFEMITGFKLNEIEFKNPIEFLRGSLTTKSDLQKIERNFQSHEPFEYELITYRKCGSPFWVHINVTPQFNDQKQFTRYIVIGMDIDERKQSEQQMQMLLNHSQKLNRQLQKRDHELRTSILDLNQQSWELQISQDALKRQKVELEKMNVELTTKAEQLETSNAEIHLKNQELERARLILASKADQMEQSNRFKSEFLANMSHELRTPLNSIIILSRLLAENKDKTLTLKQIEFSKVVNKSGSDLLILINDILDLSKIEAGKIELEKENLLVEEIGNDIKSQFNQLAQEKSIQFSVNINTPPNQKIYTDNHRLCQILKNLLSNAFKFTRDKGEVVLSISTNINNCITFAVKDNGIGIPSHKQDEIFNSFQQVDGSISRQYGGTGLGLSISRELTLLLGGNIHLESHTNIGSTFTIELPTGYDHQTVLLEHEEIHNKLLLIIEDDEIFASILEKQAIAEGYKVVVCHRGDEGLEKAKSISPDGILLDMSIPGMDGITLLKKLEESELLSKIPIHVISATKATAMKEVLPIQSWLEKPVQKEDLNKLFLSLKKSNKHHKNILVVEDNQEQALLIKHVLKKEDLTCFVAEDGASARKILRHQTIDCIILDLNLPDISGIDLLKEIKEDIAYCEIPVIVFSSKQLSALEKLTLNEYASSYIKKSPKEFEQLSSETSVFLKQIKEKDSYKVQQTITPITYTSKLYGKKVLVVDDDQRNIYALSSMLEGYQLDIISATNGNEALKKLSENNNIDMILMDVMMPVMDGFEATKIIRSKNEYKHLPIVALTAKAMKGDKEICIQAGMNNYITKPVDGNELITVMNSYFQ